MSSDIAIRVEGLGKMYRIGGPQARYSTFRETLVDAFAAPFRRAGRLLRGEGSASELDRTIWALKDVSFEVKRGEVVGIIGRNGAGKSTLLKILSRITEPTEGAADIFGRVGSLLEVGTGFHPELSGRENIYLNGAILGMRRAEIERKLDEIVAFAEIETFLDTPVKHYSSGMYVRLAFAVAAHLETEVLLIDEVLAVGDASFQRKCLEKLEDAAWAGRTVLFVSHNLAAVQALCQRTLLLERGAVAFDDLTTDSIKHYLDSGSAVDAIVDLASRAVVRTGSMGSLRALRVTSGDGSTCSVFPIGSDIFIEVDLEIEHVVQRPQMGLGVSNALGTRLFTVMPKFSGSELPSVVGSVTIRCLLKQVMLCPGRYYLKLTFGDGHGDRESVENVPAFEMAATESGGSGLLPTPISQGLVIQHADWFVVEGLPR